MQFIWKTEIKEAGDIQALSPCNAALSDANVVNLSANSGTGTVSKIPVWHRHWIKSKPYPPLCMMYCCIFSWTLKSWWLFWMNLQKRTVVMLNVIVKVINFDISCSWNQKCLYLDQFVSQDGLWKESRLLYSKHISKVTAAFTMKLWLK